MHKIILKKAVVIMTIAGMIISTLSPLPIRAEEPDTAELWETENVDEEGAVETDEFISEDDDVIREPDYNVYEEESEEDLAERESNLAEQEEGVVLAVQEVVVEAPDMGIVVSGEMPEDAEVVVQELNDAELETAEALVDEYTGENTYVETLGVYDIKVYDTDRNEYQPEDYDSMLNVAFTGLDVELYSDEFGSERIVIYHIKDDEEITEMETATDDDTYVSEASCDTNSFSWYLVGKEYVEDPVIYRRYRYGGYDLTKGSSTEFIIRYKDTVTFDPEAGLSLEIRIPATEEIIGKMQSSSYGELSDYEIKYLTEINVGEGIVKLDDAGFSECKRLQKIHFPSTLEELETSFCSPVLTDVNFEDLVNLEAITAWDPVFENCAIGGVVDLSRSKLTLIPQRFLAGNNITKVILPDTVTGIGPYAFYNCQQLQEVILPSGLNFIGSDAFSGDASLSVTIPALTMEYGTAEAYDNEYWPGVSGSQSVDPAHSVWYSAFDNCTVLNSTLSFPSGYQYHGAKVFEGTKFPNLTSITGLDYYYGFNDIDAPLLSSLSAGTVHRDSFNDSNVPSITSISWITALDVPMDSGDTNIFNRSTLRISVIPQMERYGNTGVGYAAITGSFNGCPNITSIRAEGSGGIDSCFNNCINLTTFDCGNAWSITYTANGCPNLATVISGADPTPTKSFNQTGADAYKYSLGSYSINTQTGEIKGATYGNYDRATHTLTISSPDPDGGWLSSTAISDLTFAGELEYIKTAAGTKFRTSGISLNLKECKNLKEIDFGASPIGVTSGGYASMALNCCGLKHLERVVLPPNITNLNLDAGVYGYSYGDGVFKNCTSLKTVENIDHLISFGNEIFANCYELEMDHLPAGWASSYFSFDAIENCRKVNFGELPAVVTNVTGAPVGMESLTISRLPWISGEYRTIKGCDSITSLTLESPASICDCKNLEEVTIAIPAGKKYTTKDVNISANTCPKLKKITLVNYESTKELYINEGAGYGGSLGGRPFKADDGNYYYSIPTNTLCNMTLTRQENEYILTPNGPSSTGKVIIGVHNGDTYTVKPVQYLNVSEYAPTSLGYAPFNEIAREGVYENGEEAWQNILNTVKIVRVEEGVDVIPPGFNGSSMLTDLYIGPDVTTISQFAFVFCDNLNTIHGGENVSHVSSVWYGSVAGPGAQNSIGYTAGKSYKRDEEGNYIRPYEIEKYFYYDPYSVAIDDQTDQNFAHAFLKRAYDVDTVLDSTASEALKSYDWALVNRAGGTAKITLDHQNAANEKTYVWVTGHGIYSSEELFSEVSDPDDAYIKRVLAQLAKVPAHIRNVFFSTARNNIRVISQAQMDADRGNPSTGGHYSGYLDSTSHYGADYYEIYLSAKDESIEVSTIHEFGHFVDYCLQNSGSGRPSDSSEFRAIYNSEKGGSGLDVYFTSDVHEYFAEMFREVITGGDHIGSCPQTQAYIEGCINSMRSVAVGTQKGTINMPTYEAKHTDNTPVTRTKNLIGFFTSPNGAGTKVIPCTKPSAARLQIANSLQDYTESTTLYASWGNKTTSGQELPDDDDIISICFRSAKDEKDGLEYEHIGWTRQYTYGQYKAEVTGTENVEWIENLYKNGSLEGKKTPVPKTGSEYAGQELDHFKSDGAPYEINAVDHGIAYRWAINWSVVYSGAEPPVQKYRVTFSDRFATPSSTTVEVENGSTTVFPEGSANDDYVFAGWKDSTTGAVYQPGDPTPAITGAKTFVAQYDRIDKKALMFTDRKASPMKIYDERFVAGSAIPNTIPADPVHERTTFIGWQRSGESSKTVYQRDDLIGQTLNENRTYIARFEDDPSYRIRFKVGSTYISDKVYDNSGETVEVPADPDVTAYGFDSSFRFRGWKSSATKEIYGHDDIPSVNADYKVVIYTAVMKHGDFRISFRDQKGKLIDEDYYDEGEAVSVPEAPTDEVGTFRAWYSSSTRTEYAPEEIPNASATTVYTAKFDMPAVYTIRFIDDEGNEVHKKTYTDDTSMIECPDDLPIKNGNAFGGWRSSKDSKTYAKAEIEAMRADANITFRAVYGRPNIRVMFKNGNTTLSTEYYYAGETINKPENPTMENATFVGWRDSNTKKIEEADAVLSAYQNVVYTACYDKDPTYRVIFVSRGDEPFATSRLYHEGDDVEVPADPVKTGTSFLYWKSNIEGDDSQYQRDSIPRVTQNVTYTAVFDTIPKYLVKFMNYRDTDRVGDVVVMVATKTYLRGADLEIPENPTYKGYKGKYTFNSWTPEPVSPVKADATYTAKYDLDPIRYRWMWVDYDGRIIKEELAEYGTKPKAPTSPKRDGENGKQYVFKGWEQTTTLQQAYEQWVANGQDVLETPEVIYTAQYAERGQQVRVVFKNWNNSTISTKTYQVGDKVEIPEKPVRPADTQNTYTFTGWTPEVEEIVVGAATYKAEYDSEKRKFMIKFVDEDGSVISEQMLEYGATPEKPANPTKADTETQTFKFSNWTPSVAKVTKEATYTAKYTATVKKTPTPTPTPRPTATPTATPTRIPTPTPTPRPTAVPTKTPTKTPTPTPTPRPTKTPTPTPAKQKYTIKFVKPNGEEIKTLSVAEGSKIQAPNVPNYTENGVEYKHNGWSPDFKDTATGDAVYQAKFVPAVTPTPTVTVTPTPTSAPEVPPVMIVDSSGSEIVSSDLDWDESGKPKRSLAQIVGLVTAGLLTVGAVAAAIFTNWWLLLFNLIFIKKRKKWHGILTDEQNRFIALEGAMIDEQYELAQQVIDKAAEDNVGLKETLERLIESGTMTKLPWNTKMTISTITENGTEISKEMPADEKAAYDYMMTYENTGMTALVSIYNPKCRIEIELRFRL